MHQTIRIHPDAPPKPAFGATCNGCGVCCMAEPCPVGILVSRRLRGACSALRWRDNRYWCGLLLDPKSVTGLRSARLNRWLSAVARRSISAGSGCDARLEVLPSGGPD